VEKTNAAVYWCRNKPSRSWPSTKTKTAESSHYRNMRPCCPNRGTCRHARVPHWWSANVFPTTPRKIDWQNWRCAPVRTWGRYETTDSHTFMTQGPKIDSHWDLLRRDLAVRVSTYNTGQRPIPPPAILRYIMSPTAPGWKTPCFPPESTNTQAIHLTGCHPRISSLRVPAKTQQS